MDGLIGGIIGWMAKLEGLLDRWMDEQWMDELEGIFLLMDDCQMIGWIVVQWIVV